ncbi:hypothetical protein ACTGX8_05085 [Streptococcus suis]|nr:hypothetical protein [Streptococcus suis]HEM3608885.1 hypothetical protein [Streptococcus suis]HEM3617356.1 hypothetical protein [Streptococcus suis]HEM3647261.1 hypothetical protein [Streptococcus suis]HEM3678674.1 hypothetical protein [Streptococcus suis]
MAKSIKKTNKLVRLVQVVTVVLPAIQVVRSMIKEHQDEKSKKIKLFQNNH